MSIAATLLVCSALCCSNPSGSLTTTKPACLVSGQEQITAILASPLSDLEKGRRLAVVIKSGMSIEDAENAGLPDDYSFVGFGLWRFYRQYGLTIIEKNGRVTEVHWQRP